MSCLGLIIRGVRLSNKSSGSRLAEVFMGEMEKELSGGRRRTKRVESTMGLGGGVWRKQD